MQKLFQKKQASLFPLLEKVLGNSLAPFRFLTPFSIRSSPLLRNSLRSNILAARLCRVPSKSEFRRLNLQWSLRLFPKTYALAMSYKGYGDASHKRIAKKGAGNKMPFVRVAGREEIAHTVIYL